MARDPAKSIEIGGFGQTLRRYFLDSFLTSSLSEIEKDSVVLDLGGEKVGKKGQFDLGEFPVSATYANLERARAPDVLCDATRIPFSDCSFDVVICSELLEHVPDPKAVLVEVNRVLRSAGVLIATAPFLYRIHADPEDYGRYTDVYWKRALTECGFDRIRIEKQGLFFSVLAESLYIVLQARMLAVSWPFLRRQFSKFARRVKRAAIERDRTERVSNHPILSSFTTGFAWTARKS